MTQLPPPGFDPESITPPVWQERDWPVSSLALDISGSCNLGCRYCAEGATQPPRHPMSEAVLEQAWRFLLPDGKAKQEFSIRLGCGEPLLNLSLMKKMAQMVPAVSLALTTNGTLIDRETMDWLIDSGWIVKISIDGPEQIHDRWRVMRNGEKTYRHIAEVVTEMARRIPERFSVTAVLCQGTNPAEVFDGLENLGVRRIEMVPVVHRDPSILPGDHELEMYKAFLKHYTDRWVAADEASVPPMLLRFENCMIRLMGYSLVRVSCSAGRGFIGVGPDGDLYPCFRFVGIDQYRIGHLATGLDPERVKAFVDGIGRPYDRRETCRTCWGAPVCTGPCYACAEMFGPGEGQPVPVQCAYTLANIEAAVSLVNTLRESDPEKLLKFLPRINLDNSNFNFY
ncbi:MAG: radical SAM protein [Candidatus Omnitrophota bacterium]